MRILFLFCLFFLSTTTFAKSETTISKNFYGTWGDNCEPNGQENSGFVFGRSGYIYFYKSSSNSDSKYDYYSVAFSKSKQFALTALVVNVLASTRSNDPSLLRALHKTFHDQEWFILF